MNKPDLPKSKKELFHTLRTMDESELRQSLNAMILFDVVDDARMKRALAVGCSMNPDKDRSKW